ncbi:hypothetical protein L1285_20920 [Pseudoalteromonas sp. DL2-H2.2]|uniref:hypothetical protein n=1 Tax=Pseudoalteromonas sp. DL2-H2.2 TaxID=2908889 RepID=UPI001F3F7D76|nr:hypothetical protein [Pseudoalteromonas sp. DL2-H2.2]MCF2910774.1 hypothetical protein [Pseudoalteromonas sp. DL2-H2.2]
MCVAMPGGSERDSAVIKEFIATKESKTTLLSALLLSWLLFIRFALGCLGLCISTVKGLRYVPPQFVNSISPSIAYVMANLLAIFASSFASTIKPGKK